MVSWNSDLTAHWCCDLSHCCNETDANPIRLFDRMLPLMSSWNPFTQRFQFNWFGLRLTKYSLKIMEFLRLAPVGTSRTQILLQSGGMGLARGGELGIFTPMYLMVGRVPLDKK